MWALFRGAVRNASRPHYTHPSDISSPIRNTISEQSSSSYVLYVCDVAGSFPLYPSLPLLPLSCNSEGEEDAVHMASSSNERFLTVGGEGPRERCSSHRRGIVLAYRYFPMSLLSLSLSPRPPDGSYLGLVSRNSPWGLAGGQLTWERQLHSFTAAIPVRRPRPLPSKYYAKRTACAPSCPTRAVLPRSVLPLVARGWCERDTGEERVCVCVCVYTCVREYARGKGTTKRLA